jgi:hypothetical protein
MAIAVIVYESRGPSVRSDVIPTIYQSSLCINVGYFDSHIYRFSQLPSILGPRPISSIQANQAVLKLLEAVYSRYVPSISKTLFPIPVKRTNR